MRWPAARRPSMALSRWSRGKVAKIEVGRHIEALRRLLNIKSNEGPGDIAPEVNAVFVLESDRAEWSLQKGEKWTRNRGFSAGAAGAVARIQFRNPSTSGALIIVRKLIVSHGAGAAIQLQFRHGL